MKALRMEFFTVENLSGLQESILAFLEGPNSILTEKKKRSTLNFLMFMRIELGASEQAKNTLLKSAKIFHYREFHSENFHFFVNF